MRYLFGKSNRQAIEQFATSKVLLAFDYDGTLAPIVTDPERAHMRPSTKRLLRRTASLYPSAIISGRARNDLLRLVGSIGVRDLIGNHGLEPGSTAQRFATRVRGWLPELARTLSTTPGVVIEDKRFTLAIHYRRSQQKKQALEAILQACERLRGARVFGGKQVINVLPSGAPHKGLAVEHLREEHQCDTAIYVGDDETDEDVFRLDQPAQLLTIRVGQSRTSSATYFLRGQTEIDRLLEELIALRAPARRSTRVG